MQKVTMVLALGLVVGLSACGGGKTEVIADTAGACTRQNAQGEKCLCDNHCVAMGVRTLCCNPVHNLKANHEKCPVPKGMMGGMPMTCE